MIENDVKPCPVCGKEPKIHRDYVYEARGAQFSVNHFFVRYIRGFSVASCSGVILY